MIFQIEHLTQQELVQKINYERVNRNVRERIKYTSTQRDEFYIAAIKNTKIIGLVSLQFNPYKENTIWSMGIGVDERYRNKGVASGLLKELYHFCSVNNYTLERSTPTTDGEKYLSTIHDRYKKEFPEVTVIDPKPKY